MTLPIDAVLDGLRTALQNHNRLVLQAPPGAGKTTRVPLALVNEPWLAGRRIVMLEPRRLAARNAARYMAARLGERAGQTVGYRMRRDSRVGPDTRIEVVTEGVLTRMLQDDPALEGIGLLIFDEFHERSLQADLGLALALDAQAALRDDLRLLVMSATLDGEALADWLQAPRLVSEGRAHPVRVHYLPDDARGGTRALEQRIRRAVQRALREEDGSMLVFLPGEAEIRRVQRLLEHTLDGADIDIAPLFARLEAREQDRAIQPAPPGRRKIVLATTIAETSLTIEGIRVVIDSGLTRVPRFDPNSGMSRLYTVRVSRAAAEQRRGRAGRLEPGVCYRLWGEAEQRGLLPHTPPEILQADLAPLLLELAAWGVTDADQLAWLDAPPRAGLEQARALLQDLDALDDEGRITAHGRAVAALPLHPRLAHMLIRAGGPERTALACELAALLETRDILRLPPGQASADLGLRLHAMRDFDQGRPPPELNRRAAHQVREQARTLRKRLGVTVPAPHEPGLAGTLLALAYPDRLALRRTGGTGRYQLANGRGASLSAADPLSRHEALVAVELGGDGRDARLFLAAALDKTDIEDLFPERIREQDRIEWDEREQGVLARRERRYGSLVLSSRRLDDAGEETVLPVLLQGIRRHGLDCLPWTDALRQWLQRVRFLQGIEPGWPDFTPDALLETLEDWLLPFATGMRRLSHLQDLDLEAALTARLGWQCAARLDELAPTHLNVPSGSRIRLDYTQGEIPVLAVKLQELFGLADTPRIAGGKVPVLLHLLSPARRPVQVTRDLASFWNGAYHEVKKDLKGRYPRHPWPDDPWHAPPTRRAKARK